MSTQIKKHVISQVSSLLDDKLHQAAKVLTYTILPNNISPFTLHLSVKDTGLLTQLQRIPTNNSKTFIKNICKNDFKEFPGINFRIDEKFFIQSTLSDVIKPPTIVPHNPKKIVIDYSSPNIAKPFHVGHLRSTLIGNFIANVNKYFNEKVTRINYLGDWGTQFGLLKVGMDLLNHTDEEIKNDPIQILYNAYVYANKLTETDKSISEKAKLYFNELENGNLDDCNRWQVYRDFTIEELDKTYKRLGVKFDEYHWESMYGSKDIMEIVNDLERNKIIQTHADGQKVAMVNDRSVTVLKSDGSTLYLTRDIAAVLDRYKKYSFDEMIYVVDNAQTDHFKSLFEILNQMDVSFKNKCKHVKFGRVRGMSTRKGHIVFLKDIIDEAKDKMHVQQLESKNTKVDLEDEEVTDILGTTAVIINDLKQRRQKDYYFSWDNALRSQGDSGIKLQYVHCRLWNLERNCGVELPSECCPEFIQEPEAHNLVIEIARFDDVIEKSKNDMEAYILVKYLFSLSGNINRAFKVLQVKGQPKEVAEQRLLLFHAARLVMNRGLKILGVKPLNQM